MLVAPPGAGEGATSLLLARDASPGQAELVGNQAGGRVFLFLQTDDFDRDFEAMLARGIRFVASPRRLTARSPCSRIFTAISGTWLSSAGETS